MLQILGLLSSAILFEVQISNMNIILFNGLLIRDVFERWYLIEVQCISSSVGYHILSFSLLGVLTDRDHDLTHLNSYGLFLLMHHGIIDRLIIRHVFLQRVLLTFDEIVLLDIYLLDDLAVHRTLSNASIILCSINLVKFRG